MNKNDDIIKQLEVKNREIYINKLNIDLDNNNEVLLISLDNIVNLFNEEVMNKLIELSNKNINKKELKTNVDAFYQKTANVIHNMLSNRYNVLKESINNIDSIDYKEDINKEKDLVIKSIKNEYNSLVNELINEINKKYQDSNNRINDYLKILNYNRFINKIKELLNNMSTILYNSYIESNNKFKNLNEKTLNK